VVVASEELMLARDLATLLSDDCTVTLPMHYIMFQALVTPLVHALDRSLAIDSLAFDWERVRPWRRFWRPRQKLRKEWTHQLHL
jgi:hypothetical protein